MEFAPFATKPLAAAVTIAGLAAIIATSVHAQSGAVCSAEAAQALKAANLEKRNATADAVSDRAVGFRNCVADASCKNGVQQKYLARMRDVNNKFERDRTEIEKQKNTCVLQAQTPKLDPGRPPLQGRAVRSVAGTDTTYNEWMGKPMPALRGSVPFMGVDLSVSTVKGRLGGTGNEGPVSVTSMPRRFATAQGYVLSPSQFVITRLTDLRGRPVELPGGGLTVPTQPR